MIIISENNQFWGYIIYGQTHVITQHFHILDMSFPAATFSHIPQLIVFRSNNTALAAKPTAKNTAGSDGFIVSFCWVSMFSHGPHGFLAVRSAMGPMGS